VSVLDLLVGSVVDYAIFVLDVDGKVATWNPGAERLKGYAPSEIVGQHFSTFYTEDDLEAGLPDRELAIAAAEGRFEDEGWRVRKDGSRFWANVVITSLRGEDGQLLGFGKVTRDLTERKRSEDSLRESEERFRLLVSGVSDYAIFLLDRDGTVASWNLGAERLKGYRPDEIVGRHFSTFYTEEDRRAGVPQAGLAEALEVGRWESEGWRIRNDGSRFWANVVITALRGQDGEERGFAKVTRDLTDRKRSEDALRGILERERDAAEQLREIDRMRRELVTLVAHDLRGPVGVVQSLLDILLGQWTDLSDEQRLEAVARARARTVTLALLTDDVFDIALIDTGSLSVEVAPVDVGALVGQLADDLALGAGRTIRRDIGPGAVALADERRTGQVVSNLLSNAFKFSPNESPIDVCVERADDEVVVAVSDAGSGISEADQGRIFDRFARLTGDRHTPGSGLGLFIARSLVEAQGGRITVDSTPGSGATFRFTLPLAPAAAH